MEETKKRKIYLFIFSWIAIFALVTACSSKKEEKESEELSLTQEDVRKLSETMGHMMVQNMNTQNIKMDIDGIIKGIRDAQAGEAAPLTKQEFFKMVATYRREMQQIKGQENLKIAEDFLTDNGSKAGVKSLEDGKLQYQILEEGTGPIVKKDGKPLIHYEGKFVDGKVFDSSKKRGQAVPFSLKSTIPGFKLGVEGMKEGEKRRIFIHPELGYGNRGRLPPNSLLIFDVEIVEAEHQPPAAGTANTPEESKEIENKETSYNFHRK